MFYTYVIKSKSNDKIYIGQTENLEERLRRHNGLKKNKVSSFTKINKGPWEVIYQEEYETREEAISRERFLKSHKGRDWLRSDPLAQW